MGIPNGEELLLILAIVVLLFGSKKIPELARGLGTGLKEFKKAKNESPLEEKKEDKKEITENKNA